jgi:adenylate cyclase
MPLSWQTRRRLSLAGVYVLCAVTAVTASLATGGIHQIDGPLMDVVLWGRAELFPTAIPFERPVAVVTLDQKSLDDADLAHYPRAMFGPVWGSLIDGLMNADAQVVGFDLLLAYSGNQLKADFDAEFLTALARYHDKLVLARSATTLPAPVYQAALGSAESPLGLVELQADADGAYRRVPATLALEEGDALPSLANAVLHRAGVTTMPREVLLAPRWHLETIPTYSLVDVLRCAKADPGTLRSIFRGKLVFVGTTLAEEDRKRSPALYLDPPVTSPGRGACGLPQLGISVPRARTVPGVYLHAAAVEAVLTREDVRTAPVAVTALLAAAAALIGVSLAMILLPWQAALGLVTTVLLLFLGTIGALNHQLWIPTGLPLLALPGSASVAYLARYLFEDRRRRDIQKAFSHYLSPAVVEGLAADPSALKLGGERREVTVMFADLSGFTAYSTTVQPEQLTAVLNRQLGYIVDEVEATGGYVDKFLGDAVLAIWGAPVADPQHGIHAVQAARRVVARFTEEQGKAGRAGLPQFGIKIGMNAGPAIVGNVGTNKRYNYTAIGETVNLASRLEGVPGLYACRIVIGAALASLVADAFLLRELDRIQVKGKDAPVVIYEPLAWKDFATELHKQIAREYGEALALYRSRRFLEAAERWDATSILEARAADEEARQAERLKNPSSVMAMRTRQLAVTPPAESWNGVWVLSSK